jgi:hypothetical protein
MWIAWARECSSALWIVRKEAGLDGKMKIKTLLDSIRVHATVHQPSRIIHVNVNFLWLWAILCNMSLNAQDRPPQVSEVFSWTQAQCIDMIYRDFEIQGTTEGPYDDQLDVAIFGLI